MHILDKKYYPKLAVIPNIHTLSAITSRRNKYSIAKKLR